MNNEYIVSVPKGQRTVWAIKVIINSNGDLLFLNLEGALIYSFAAGAWTEFFCA